MSLVVSHANHNECTCAGKFYFPDGITQNILNNLPTPKTCIPSCKSLFLTSTIQFGNSQCETCLVVDPTKPYFDELSQSCVTICPKYTITDNVNKICIKCQTLNSALPIIDLKTNNCIASGDNCPIDTVFDLNMKSCELCKLNTDGNTLKLWNECRTGIGCSDPILNAIEGASFSTTGNCICSLGKYYLDQGINIVSDAKPTYIKSCVNSCNMYYLVVVPGKYGNKCTTCDTIDISKPYFDLDSKSCLSLSECKSKIDTIIDSFNKICYPKCKFLYDNNCVESCPIGYYTINNNECLTLKQLKKYKYIDNLVDECPINYIPDNSNVCKATCLQTTCRNEGICSVIRTILTDNNNILCSCSKCYQGQYCQIQVNPDVTLLCILIDYPTGKISEESLCILFYINI